MLTNDPEHPHRRGPPPYSDADPQQDLLIGGCRIPTSPEQDERLNAQSEHLMNRLQPEPPTYRNETEKTDLVLPPDYVTIRDPGPQHWTFKPPSESYDDDPAYFKAMKRRPMRKLTYTICSTLLICVAALICLASFRRCLDSPYLNAAQVNVGSGANHAREKTGSGDWCLDFKDLRWLPLETNGEFRYFSTHTAALPLHSPLFLHIYPSVHSPVRVVGMGQGSKIADGGSNVVVIFDFTLKAHTHQKDWPEDFAPVPPQLQVCRTRWTLDGVMAEGLVVRSSISEADLTLDDLKMDINLYLPSSQRQSDAEDQKTSTTSSALSAYVPLLDIMTQSGDIWVDAKSRSVGHLQLQSVNGEVRMRNRGQ